MDSKGKQRTVAQEIELEARLRTGKLSLRSFSLEELPTALFGLKHLVSLDLRFNALTTIPLDILQLRQLRDLFLTGNTISAFPEYILDLPSLELLDLAGNQLSELPDRVENLRTLRHLNICNNRGIKLPDTLHRLHNLRELVAAGIGLDEIPTEITSCSSLRELNLQANAITEFPSHFANLKDLRTLYIDVANITMPPLEIIHRGPGAIVNYLHAFDAGGPTFVLREVKLLIVGQGGVGKTFLAHRLVADAVPMADQTTEGIAIRGWSPILSDGNTVKINIWDFGGQEIYHSTHQFFLTKRSVYVFVWDSRREDNILSFDYWLNAIQLLSDSSPVLVVQNKVDERIKMVDEVSLTEKFQSVSSFHKVSAISGLGIEQLRNSILASIPRLEHFGDKLPLSWQTIRTELESYSAPFISHSTYLNACAKHGLDQRRADYLSQYFHDLGVFLHFQDNEVLRKIIFLKPEWATNAVYKLIDTRSVQENCGKFTLADLDAIWSDIPDVRFIHLIELMKRFELCFQTPDSHEYIIPELLTTTRPNFAWDEESNLHFHFEYDFMPSGILTRLIVRMHGYAHGETYWKNGVVFVNDGSQALVIAHPLQRRISIQIDGDERSSMLSMIRREIETIHKSMNQPKVRELIPCVCLECKASDSPYMHDFEYLKRAKARQKWTVECKNSLEEVRVDSILKDVRKAWNSHRSTVLRPATGHSVSLLSLDSDIGRDLDERVTIGPLTVRRNYSTDILPITGITADQYHEIVLKLSELSSNELQKLSALVANLNGSEPSEENIERWRAFSMTNGVAVAQNLTASALYDLLKFLFP